MYNTLFKQISNASFIEFAESSQSVLNELVTQKDLLRMMLKDVLNNELLQLSAESYDFLDKFVIYYDEQVQVRISVFNQKYGNRIHYHRWNYSSYILKGGYTQYIYGMLPKGEEDINILNTETPLVIENLYPGVMYSLENSVIHSICAIPDSISISIRGVSVRDRFCVLDQRTLTKWWQYGHKLEAQEERLMKRMEYNDLQKKISDLCLSI